MDFFYKANMEKSRARRYRHDGHNKDLVEDIFAEARGMFEDLTSSSEESNCSADSKSDDSSENPPQKFPRVEFESEEIL
jgi:hypothetical protein